MYYHLINYFRITTKVGVNTSTTYNIIFITTCEYVACVINKIIHTMRTDSHENKIRLIKTLSFIQFFGWN